MVPRSWYDCVFCWAFRSSDRSLGYFKERSPLSFGRWLNYRKAHEQLDQAILLHTRESPEESLFGNADVDFDKLLTVLKATVS